MSQLPLAKTWLLSHARQPARVRAGVRVRVTAMVRVRDRKMSQLIKVCLVDTSDAADELLCVDLGGRRIIKKKNSVFLAVISFIV